MSCGANQLDRIYSQVADIYINLPVSGDDAFQAGTGQQVIAEARQMIADKPIDWSPARPTTFEVVRRTAVDAFYHMLPGLGSTEEGADSLRCLVTQSEDDSPDDESWDVRHLPLRVRFPWILQAFDRTVTALATLWFCHLVLPAVSGGSTDLVMSPSGDSRPVPTPPSCPSCSCSRASASPL